MNPNHLTLNLAIALALASVWQHPSSAAEFLWAPVGNLGNPDDTSFGAAVGAVSHRYRIGKFEVTNDQYAEFLNAKARLGDDLQLYHLTMQIDARLGIAREGAGTVGDPYVYTVKPNMGNKPVGMVSIADAMRFANWVNNGQGSGDTESGAYALLGAAALPSNAASIVRNPTARVFLPSEDEWHKAAYYEPGASGDSYWTYATRSDNPPVKATANAFGDINNPGPNVVNYDYNAEWNGAVGNVTTVGSAGPFSQSYYGAADMTGNQFEATETLSNISEHYILKGGSWADGLVFQDRNQRPAFDLVFQDPAFGFRLASIPEPMSVQLALAAAAMAARHAGRRRRG
jgi:formylglycine-generating enzyme required for sulfatase activity